MTILIYFLVANIIVLYVFIGIIIHRIKANERAAFERMSCMYHMFGENSKNLLDIYNNIEKVELSLLDKIDKLERKKNVRKMWK